MNEEEKIRNQLDQNQEEVDRDLKDLSGDDFPFKLSDFVSSAYMPDYSKQHNVGEPITPELLQHFSRDQADGLMRYFVRTPSQESYGYCNTYDFTRLSPEAKSFLQNELVGKRIIELGAGSTGGGEEPFKVRHGEFTERLGAKEWYGVDPKRNYDALTFLMRQPDESAIVTSFGFLEDGVLYNGFNESEDLIKYQQELGKQIHRVTPRGAITLHGLEWDYDLIRAGFKPDSNVPIDFLKGRDGDKRLRVLRRTE